MNPKNLVIFFLGGLLLLLFVVLVMSNIFGWTNEPVACTLEAMQCPDGSYVGRIGPQCEFAPCPASTSNNLFNTAYVSAVDWPPIVQVTDDAFTCIEAGNEHERAGITEQTVIDGSMYCVTRVSEGAAGSTYIQYAYATPSNVGTDIFTFSLRYPQCMNYEEFQRAECVQDQKLFRDRLDMFIHEFIQTYPSNII